MELLANIKISVPLLPLLVRAEILNCFFQQGRVVLKTTEGSITEVAQQSAYFASRMTVINRQPAPRRVRITADSAYAALHDQHGLVVGFRQSKLFERSAPRITALDSLVNGRLLPFAPLRATLRGVLILRRPFVRQGILTPLAVTMQPVCGLLAFIEVARWLLLAALWASLAGASQMNIVLAAQFHQLFVRCALAHFTRGLQLSVAITIETIGRLYCVALVAFSLCYIGLSHAVYAPIVNGVVRPVRELVAPVRAVLILPQLTAREAT